MLHRKGLENHKDDVKLPPPSVPPPEALYYEARNDYTNNSETILVRVRSTARLAVSTGTGQFPGDLWLRSLEQHRHGSLILSQQRVLWWCDQFQSSLTRVRKNQPSRQQSAGQRSPSEGAREAVHQLLARLSEMPLWHHLHHRGWKACSCHRMSMFSHHTSDQQLTRSS